MRPTLSRALHAVESPLLRLSVVRPVIARRRRMGSGGPGPKGHDAEEPRRHEGAGPTDSPPGRVLPSHAHVRTPSFRNASKRLDRPPPEPPVVVPLGRRSTVDRPLRLSDSKDVGSPGTPGISGEAGPPGPPRRRRRRSGPAGRHRCSRRARPGTRSALHPRQRTRRDPRRGAVR